MIDWLASSKETKTYHLAEFAEMKEIQFWLQKQFIVQTNFRTRTTRFASIFTRKKNWYSFLFVDCVFFSLAQLLFSSRIKHDLLTRVGILHASTQFLNAIYKIHHPSRGICAFVLSVSQPVSFNCFPTRRNGHEFNEIFKKERMTSREN